MYREEKTSKAGKPYTSLRIKTIEYGDRYLSGFGNASNKDWKEGSEVEIIVTETQKDDKTYLNFETPKAEKVAIESMKGVEVKLGFMAQNLKEIDSKLNRILVHIGAATKLEEAYATEPGKPFEDDREVPPLDDSDVPF